MLSRPVQPHHVLAAGAVGGALSWIFAVTIGVPPFLAQWWQAVPATMALGSGAAFVGVYLLASPDTTQMPRCLAFALICGFAWKPVWDGGTALVDRSTRREQLRTQAARLEDRSEDVTRALAQQPPREPSTSVPLAAELARQLTGLALVAEDADPDLAARLRLRAAGTVTVAADAVKRLPPEPSPAPNTAQALPVDDMRAALLAAQQQWSQRDPTRAEQFSRALTELNQATAQRQ